MKKGSIKIKISDLAIKAGVSAGTVDRVLHNRGEVSEVTRNKVLKVVEELKYTPDILARTLASKKKQVIALLIPEVTEATKYWELPRQGINKALVEYAFMGIDVQAFFFNYFDKKSFVKKYNEILKSGPFLATILAPVFIKETQEFLGLCNNINLPYVLIDSQVRNAAPIAYIGQNTVQSGWVAGRLMSYAMVEHGQILVLTITNETNTSLHFKFRSEGFKSYFANYNNLKTTTIKEVVLIDPTEDQVFAKLDEVVTDKIKGVFVPNSRAFIIADYVEKKGIKGINIVGYDLLPKNIEQMRKGNIDFLISQRPEDQGYRAVQSVVNALIMKKEVDKEQFMPIDIITKENVDFYNL